ncbi:MAG TPA: FKBP-type peptidyl-prolyl cis-trans isomerase [Phaeodactylibacter sp.]|nr:FKBP-type peptidyl-prolyl cis-trans isomerase [Phaeodactylibacter sp.]
MAKLNKIFVEKNQMLTETLEAYKAGTLGTQLQKTESGLEYVVLEEGNGPKPQSGQMVTVEYIGVLKEDGKKFDESITRVPPFSFAVGKGQVIPGWDEGIELLSQGSEAVLFIPYQLAYGEAGSPPVIPEKADLVFYVELTDVQ